MLVLIFVLCFCVSCLSGCGNKEPEVNHALPEETASPYQDMQVYDLLCLMCECDCDMLSNVAEKGSLRCLADVYALGDGCPIIKELFNQYKVIEVLESRGLEVYEKYAASDDPHIQQNAKGLRQIMQILCPDV